MKIGDLVRATWPDGLTLEGKYVATERGYVILMSAEGEHIICGQVVKLEVIDEDR